MSRTVTDDQVVNAARELDQNEFTRAELAAKLGVERSELKRGFKAARQAGSLEKVRTDDEGAARFRLSG